MAAMKKLFLITLSLALFFMLRQAVETEAQSLSYEVGQKHLKRLKDKFGWAKEKAVTGRVEKIFGRVCLAADIDPAGVKVFVANSRELNALSLPGGFVVIHRGLYDLCDNDDELAFILAHELAHLAANHHDNMETALAGFAAEFGLGRRLPREISGQKEIEADQKGVIFGAVAGYDPRGAFTILDKAIAKLDAGRVPKEVRKQKIGERLRAATDKIDLFHLGLLFFYRGDLSAAEGAFRNFLSVYESSEVYNNLGVVYHRRASHTSSDSCRSGPPTIKSSPLLDIRTTAEKLSVKAGTGKERCDDQNYREWLHKAISRYKKAGRLNPNHTKALINLGIAYDDLEEYDTAVSVYKKALKFGESLKELHNNLGVAYIYLKEFEKASKSLNRALDLDKDFAPPYFNLGVLEELAGGRNKKAEDFFKKFLKKGKGRSSGRPLHYARGKAGNVFSVDKTGTLEREIVLSLDSIEGIEWETPRKKVREKLGPPDVEWAVSADPEIIVNKYEDKGLWVVYKEGKVLRLAANKGNYRTHDGLAVGTAYDSLVKTAEIAGARPAKLYIRDGRRLFVGSRSTGKIIQWMVF